MKINVAYKAFGDNNKFEFPSELVPIWMHKIDALEVVFRQCNHVDGTEWISGKRLRSLSVGDEVSIDNETYLCAGCGWEKKS